MWSVSVKKPCTKKIHQHWHIHLFFSLVIILTSHMCLETAQHQIILGIFVIFVSIRWKHATVEVLSESIIDKLYPRNTIIVHHLYCEHCLNTNHNIIPIVSCNISLPLYLNWHIAILCRKANPTMSVLPSTNWFSQENGKMLFSYQFDWAQSIPLSKIWCNRNFVNISQIKSYQPCIDFQLFFSMPTY